MRFEGALPQCARFELILGLFKLLLLDPILLQEKFHSLLRANFERRGVPLQGLDLLVHLTDDGRAVKLLRPLTYYATHHARLVIFDIFLNSLPVLLVLLKEEARPVVFLKELRSLADSRSESALLGCLIIGLALFL